MGDRDDAAIAAALTRFRRDVCYRRQMFIS